MQILVSIIEEDTYVPIDVNKPEDTLEAVKHPALNEVVKAIPVGRTASVSGDDINITPRSIIPDGTKILKIVDVDSVPDDWKPNAFLYDGTTWSTNPNYAKLTATPDI